MKAIVREDGEGCWIRLEPENDQDRAALSGITGFVGIGGSIGENSWFVTITTVGGEEKIPVTLA